MQSFLRRVLFLNFSSEIERVGFSSLTRGFSGDSASCNIFTLKCDFGVVCKNRALIDPSGQEHPPPSSVSSRDQASRLQLSCDRGGSHNQEVTPQLSETPER